MYDLQPSESLMEALTMAGGTTSEPADSTVTLVRGDERHAIPVTAVYASDPTAKLTLRTADTLTVDSVELLPVYVTGMAHTPGLQMLRAGAGALEALAQAGGLAIPESDARAAIVRGGHEVQVVDLRAAARKVAGANAPLQRGDVLAITSLRTVRVMVTGKVKQPGFCDLTPGEGLIEALTLAGGALPEAALGHVRLTHTSGATEVINMAAAFQEGKKQVNVTLSDGDLVVVPEFSRAVAVLGYVQSPGYYPLVEGKILTISDAIGLAKGPENRRGGINRVAVMSVADDGTQTRKIVNLDKYFKTGDAQYNPEVKAGDIIYVPETAKPDWTAVFQSLANLATVSIAAKQF